MPNKPPLSSEQRLLLKVARITQFLKPDVSLTDAHLLPHGHLEATVCLPDGSKAPVVFVELDDDEDADNPES
jgi:hypothetical protein